MLNIKYRVRDFKKGGKMGKDINGKNLGKGFGQRKSDKLYYFRYTDRFGKRSAPIYDESISSLRKKVKPIIAKNTLKLNKSSLLTLNELFQFTKDLYLETIVKEDTAIAYSNVYIRYISKTSIGNKKLDEIRPYEILEILTNIGNHYSISVTRESRIILNHMYDFAVINEWTNTNPVKSMKVKSAKEQKVILPLTIEQQKLFLEYSQDSYYNIFYRLILQTGLRFGEAAAIRIQDINFEKRELYVRRAMRYKSTKGLYKNGEKVKFDKPKYNSIRTVPLNDKAIEILREQLYVLPFIKKNYFRKNNKPFKELDEFKDLLFYSRSGSPLWAPMVNLDISRIVKKINKEEEEAMNDFGVHTLRHTFATRCYENGVDPLKLQTVLGHKSLDTTLETYVSVMPNSNDLQCLNDLDNSNSSSYLA